jgi:hypothetical protein
MLRPKYLEIQQCCTEEKQPHTHDEKTTEIHEIRKQTTTLTKTLPQPKTIYIYIYSK